MPWLTLLSMRTQQDAPLPVEVEEKALKLRFVKDKQTLKVIQCHSPGPKINSVVGSAVLGAAIRS